MEQGAEDDLALVRRFREGDDSALQTLFSRHQRRLSGRLAPLLPPDLRRRISVEDLLLQEAYLTAYRRISEFEERHAGGFAVWLERIAAFKLKEEIRRYRKTAKRGAVREITHGARPDTHLFLGPGPTPSEVASRGEDRERALRAMDRLPEDYRTVLMLVQVEQLTLREAGEKMGRSREAAKKLYGRALNRLATLLQSGNADGD